MVWLVPGGLSELQYYLFTCLFSLLDHELECSGQPAVGGSRLHRAGGSPSPGTWLNCVAVRIVLFSRK